MLKMWDVGDVVYPRCRRFRMWDVQDVRDVRCSGCEIFDIWGIWDVGSGMLIYKMPNIVRSFLYCYSNSLKKIVQLYCIIVYIISK